MFILDYFNDKWVKGKKMVKGKIVKYDGEEYRVLRTHRAAHYWKPDTTMNLFERVK